MKKKTNKNPKNKLSLSKSAIAFYVMAGISFLTFIYSMYSVYTYLDSLITAGQITWAANWLDMLGYYLGSSNGFNYLLFAAILAGIGYIIALMKKGHTLPVEDVVEVFPENLAEEITETVEINENEEVKEEVK